MQHERLPDIKWWDSAALQAKRSPHNTAELCHALQRLNKGHRSPISQVNKSQSEMRCFLYWNNGFPIGENMAGDETQ